MLELITTAVREILSVFPEPQRAEIEQGLRDLKMPLHRLALEVLDAEAKGLSYREAAARDGEYILLPQYNRGLLDFLQYEVPVAHVPMFRQAVRGAMDRDPGPIRRGLLVAAAFGRGEGGALARYACYQAVRFNVWMINWDDNGALEASGVMVALDEVAERVLRKEIALARRAIPAGDPLGPLVAGTLREVERLFRDFRADQRGSLPEILRHFDAAAKFYEAARRMAAPEAVLIRNGVERALDRDFLDDERLALLHPLAFPSKDALHQRRKRLKAAHAAAGNLPAARKTRVVDLFFAAISEDA